MNRSVEIHIEHLVLHGLSPHERHHIGDAVQAVLQQMFAQQGLPAMLTKGIFIQHLDAGAFDIHHGQKPAATGESIAGTLYKGLSNEGGYRY